MDDSRSIDIIIPVYNAFQDLQLCVQSIKKQTNLNLHRLIFINDNSPDQQIKPYLDSLSSENIIVIHNEKNFGFSANINKGINYSDRDVILLNTDTIVTKNWIKKLTEAAYSNPSIGTVTPFSNNATLCSIPEFCQENKIPNNISIDDYAELIEHCSFKKYPHITVAVGFCMYIKRELIDIIGGFDAETFGRGYGEENDFCNRAEQYGYYHILCDDTFIYHSGTASFVSQDKKELMLAHEKILMKRYRQQMEFNHRYVMTNPDQYLRDNVSIYTDLINGKKNILYFLQADFRDDASNNIGGTQFHVKDLVYGLKENANIFVMARDRDFLRLTAYTDKKTISFKFHIGASSLFPVAFDNHIAEIVGSVLIGFSIDLVHIHHVQGLSFDIFYETKKLGIPLIASVHDYFYVCPSFNLLTNEDKVCIDIDGTEVCQQCLSKKMGYSPTVNVVQNWRLNCKNALILSDLVVVPSNSVRSNLIKYFPEIGNRIKVIEHGLDIPPIHQLEYSRENTDYKMAYYYDIPLNCTENEMLLSGWAYLKNIESKSSEIFIEIKDSKGLIKHYRARKYERLDVSPDNPKYIHCGFTAYIPQDIFTDGYIEISIIISNGEIVVKQDTPYTISNHKFKRRSGYRVAFLGGINVPKGSKCICNIIKKSSNDIQWYIFGGIGDVELHLMQKNNLIKTDWYVREEVTTLLQQNRIDLVCILSICPETFCYTISESISSGIPVLVTDIGALSERVNKMNCGWVIPMDSTPKEILNKILEIRNNKIEYDNKKDIISKIDIRSKKDMCDDYKEIYQSLYITKAKTNDYNKKIIYEAFLLGNTDKPASIYTESIDSNLLTKFEQVQAQLHAVQNSIEYKAIQKLIRMRIPFKKQLKSIARVMLKILKI